jgi:hypothetical protein
MRLSERLRRKLFDLALNKIVFARTPDLLIGGDADPYLIRWFVTPWSRYDRGTAPANLWQAIRRRMPNIYVHRFIRSDADFALHDHPWASMTIVLRGAYVEQTIAAGGVHQRALRRPGDVAFRKAKAAHRVELLRDAAAQDLLWRYPKEQYGDEPVYTLFITGPKVRNWGFHCPRGWRPWEEFSSGDYGKIGRGCE